MSGLTNPRFPTPSDWCTFHSAPPRGGLFAEVILRCSPLKPLSSTFRQKMGRPRRVLSQFVIVSPMSALAELSKSPERLYKSERGGSPQRAPTSNVRGILELNFCARRSAEPINCTAFVDPNRCGAPVHSVDTDFGEGPLGGFFCRLYL